MPRPWSRFSGTNRNERLFIVSSSTSEERLVSAATLVELSIVMESRHGDAGVRTLDDWLQRAGVEVIDVDEEQALRAREAFRRFGKGRHSAGLNFGDCFSYALAVARRQPLLFKGEDFSRTDVEPAAP